MIDNRFGGPNKTVVCNKPEFCISWNKGRCNHEAYKGAYCPGDHQCILWKQVVCIDCKNDITSEVICDKDNFGPYCSLCFERLPKELK